MNLATMKKTPYVRKIQAIAMMLPAILLPATQSGCLIAAAAAGTGATVAYMRGDDEAVLNADPQRVTAAAEAAAKEMDLVVVSATSSKIDGRVNARTARDVSVVIVAQAEGEQATRVKVRVGRFGDDSIQATILEKIRHNLDASKTTTASTNE